MVWCARRKSAGAKTAAIFALRHIRPSSSARVSSHHDMTGDFGRCALSVLAADHPATDPLAAGVDLPRGRFSHAVLSTS
jgi:hypothetical protein